MMNSLRSSTGKNSLPTLRTIGTLDGSVTATARPTSTSAARAATCRPSLLTANTTITMPASAAANPVRPRTGSTNDEKNVPAARAIMPVRWSSAHAITFL